MASDKPESVRKWRHGTSGPVTVTASRFAELVLEHGLRVLGPDSDGYKYCALETEDGYDLYRAPDVDWDKIPMMVGTTADPAAGAQCAAVTVPAGKRYRIQSARLELVASADVANRIMNVRITVSGTSLHYISANGVTITASQTADQSFIANSLVVTAGTRYGMHMPMVEIPAGGTFQIYTSTLQAADNLTAMEYSYQEAPA